MQGTNLRHTTRPGNAMMERRNRNRQDVKRIMSTAKAIADDDSHPNQDEVPPSILSSLTISLLVLLAAGV
jgi:hypothetical protein